MFIRILVILSILVPINSSITAEEKDIEIESRRCYQLNKDSIDNYPLDEIMSAIAYHECFNLTQEERFLVMEAFLNRIEDNFNNNGKTVKEQLLAPKQFTGLWKYNSQQWKYDSSDTISVQNKEMAQAIITGYRLSKQRLYYWAGSCDKKTAHGKFVARKKINTKTVHWFR